MITRRSFLITLGAMAGAASCSQPGAGQAGATVARASRRRLDRIGIQLYSVRDEMQRDLPGTLARLAQIGYREVEFAGYFGRSAQDIRALLEQNRLTAPSTHLPIQLMRERWDATLDDAVARGHQFVTIPWLAESERGSADNWRRIADEFNAAAAKAKARGLGFAYHNHDFEFQRTDGQVPFDLLLERTDPSLVFFEMDVYWTVRAGGDPLDYFRRHPARFAMLHLKDSAGPPDHRMVDVGAGSIDFASILRLDDSQRHAVKHVFVEHDSPADPFGFARKSFDHLSQLEY